MSITNCTVSISQEKGENITMTVKKHIPNLEPIVDTYSCEKWSVTGTRTLSSANPRSIVPDDQDNSCNDKAWQYCRASAKFNTDSCKIKFPEGSFIPNQIKFNCDSPFRTLATTKPTLHFTTTIDQISGGTRGRGGANDFPIWAIILSASIVLLLMSAVVVWKLLKKWKKQIANEKPSFEPQQSGRQRASTNNGVQPRNEMVPNPVYGSVRQAATDTYRMASDMTSQEGVLEVHKYEIIGLRIQPDNGVSGDVNSDGSNSGQATSSAVTEEDKYEMIGFKDCPDSITAGDENSGTASPNPDSLPHASMISEQIRNLPDTVQTGDKISGTLYPEESDCTVFSDSGVIVTSNDNTASDTINNVLYHW